MYMTKNQHNLKHRIVGAHHDAPANSVGIVVGISGQVIEAEFQKEKPGINEIVVWEKDPNLKFLISSSKDDLLFYCLALGDVGGIARGEKLIITGHALEIPVGEGVLGRVIDIWVKVLIKLSQKNHLAGAGSVFGRNQKRSFRNGD